MSESVERSYPEVWRRRLARRRLAAQLLYAAIVLLVVGAVGAAENVTAGVPWLAAAGLLVIPLLLASYLLRLFAGPYRCPRCGHVFSQQQTLKRGWHALVSHRWLTQSCLHCHLPLTRKGSSDPAILGGA